MSHFAFYILTTFMRMEALCLAGELYRHVIEYGDVAVAGRRLLL